MWSYFVQVAMCTKWGSAARSRELAASVAKHSQLALSQVPTGYVAVSPASSPSRASASPPPTTVRGSLPSESEWSVVGGPKPVAHIVYEPQHEAWLYGLHLCVDEELPPFPELPEKDMAIMQPLPHDGHIFMHGPAQGLTYVIVASAADWSPFCREILGQALRNEPMSPEVYRFAAYLYARVQLVRSTALRLLKSTDASGEVSLKRPQDENNMQATRCIYVPLQMSRNPQDIDVKQCDVMMVSEASVDTCYAMTEEDPPGLAILDSGCTRTMHGFEWATAFEDALSKEDLAPVRKSKTQRFRGWW